jgi:hypothetical protein
MFTPSFTPRGEHSLYFYKEWREKQNFTPLGTTSPLGAKLRMCLRTALKGLTAFSIAAGCPTLEGLPEEILVKILSSLTTYDLLHNVAPVCKKFRRLARDRFYGTPFGPKKIYDKFLPANFGTNSTKNNKFACELWTVIRGS